MSQDHPLLFEQLEQRIGKDHLAKRLRLQVDHPARYYGLGFGGFHWENSNLLPVALKFLLRVSGLFQLGKRNVLDYEVVKIDVTLNALPEAFDNLRILQLSAIHIVGLDDAHFYGVARLEKAIRGLPADDVKLLLVHSPEMINEAASVGMDYYLCGHTHWWQVCLSGGFPLLTNASCARTFVAGAWRYQGMAGYTSRGTGSSGVSVHFCCPPEITLHRLKSSP